jgi:hypothetical protein
LSVAVHAVAADWWLPFDADITVALREGGQTVFAARGDEPVTITCPILRVADALSGQFGPVPSERRLTRLG